MLWGSLPKVHFSKSVTTKKAFLKSYIQTYIKEEIRIEQLVRDLDPFRDFLEVAAQMNGKVINFSRIAKEAGTSDKTVHSYFQILQDTFLGFYLPSFHRSIRKSQSEHPKFYFFDCGVKRQLDRTLGTDLIPSTKAFGDAFEHFLILEIYRRSHYENKDWTFSFFRTKEGNEIDLVISLDRKREILVEIKSTEKLDTIDLNFFKNIAADFKSEKNYVLSMDPSVQKIELLDCYPWQQGLEDLFKNF